MRFALEKIQTDILIIGSGAAAGMAALEACKYGLKVLMADRGRLARSGSSATAGGGTAAAFGHTMLGKKGNPDTPDIHFRDIVVKGRFLSQQHLVRRMVDEIRDRVIHLTDIGIPYVRTEDNLYYQNQGVGQTWPRNCTPRGNGAFITEFLVKEAAFRRARFLERTRIVHLFTRDGLVVGALGVHFGEQKLYLIEARSIILCSGSATALQPYASAAFKTFGDSYRLAFDAGASLADMEFLEFTFIPLAAGKAVPCGGSTQITSRGGRFYNRLGERFMERYNPQSLERTTRAALVPAFYREIMEGRGPVYLDCATIAPELWEEWESIGHSFLGFLKAVNPDYRRAHVSLVPALHCCLGGVRIDEFGRTNVEGLYAAGEASTGIHGAVRLGGGAFAECYVFGTRAGGQAAVEACSRQALPVGEDEVARVWDDLIGSREASYGADFDASIRELQQEAWRTLSVVRNGWELKQGYDYFLREYEAQPAYAVRNAGELEAKVTLRGLTFTGLACAAGALAREETRGGHVRDDYPNENNAFLAHFLFERDNGFSCLKEPVSFGANDISPEKEIVP